MMENCLTCILIEDEALGIEMMEDYINRRDDLRLLGTAIQLSEIEALLDSSPSIIFLDLMIPYGDQNDFNFSKFPNSSSFIVTSAIPINHFKGELPPGKIYELLKPISFQNFNKCVDKVVQTIKSS